MKEIKISEEDYNFLKECKELLNTQDNRITRDPIYCIMDYEKIPTDSDYSDEYEWMDVHSDYCIIGQDEDIIDYFLESGDEENYQKIKLYLEKENDKVYENEDDLKEAFLEELSWGYSDDLKDFGIDGVDRHYYLYTPKIKQGSVFSFFEKDALEHLEKNDYHYTHKSHTYACALWRSPRMEKLRKLLIELDI